MSYDNNLTGILMKNDKAGNESRPDYKGSVDIDGQKFWLSAWIKTGRGGTKLEGQKYMSLKLEPAEARQAPPQRQAPQQRQAPPQRQPQRQPPQEEFYDDDIPF